ncbi:putative site-specific integrase-resolvase [Actinoplanes couchii]|uniref:IS607 family transposase n=2 Tax=Actinoplanes couchii TaxID=403638 RepID=UPI0028651ADE|nr:IS607 family transposase [Actinoplanes couchii]MDR6318435.1 putative site-specific integrase-resolvase [Actinoplanes couchii]
MVLVRLAPAVGYVGVHPVTLRRWADEGRVDVVWVGRERRFDTKALDVFLGVRPGSGPRREALYVRVSGRTGQGSSLTVQETELRATASGEVVAVFQDKASGLRENRPGLTRLLAAAAVGEVTVVRVTHEDRLARFGVVWLTALLARSGVTVEVLHPKGSAGGMDELLADFTSLVSTFAGRIYGIRSREARRRLLTAADPPS